MTCLRAQLLSCVCWLFATPWTIAYQAPLSVGFLRQECWSGKTLPFLPPGNLPDPGIQPASSAMAGGFLPLRSYLFREYKTSPYCFVCLFLSRRHSAIELLQRPAKPCCFARCGLSPVATLPEVMESCPDTAIPVTHVVRAGGGKCAGICLDTTVGVQSVVS